MKLDEQLLRDIKEGKISSFEQFFQNSYARLLNYAKLFIKDEGVATDMVQESFIHFWDKRKELRTGKSIESLIFTSVRNRCLNYLRDKDTYNKHLENFKVEQSVDIQYLTQYDFLGSEQESIEELIAKELEISINKLPEKCRQVFLMNKKDGKKQKEIAEELGISQKAVEKHIATAKTKLKESLELKFPALGLLIAFFIEF